MRLKQNEINTDVLIHKLRSRDAAVCIRDLCSSDFYIAYARGDWWLTTDRTKPRNVSEIGWTTDTIYAEIDNAGVVTPMELLEAPFGHLIAHHPDSRTRTVGTL